MEKRFKVTKKTVLKSVEPETFETNEQWVKDNKRFAKFFVIEEIEEKEDYVKMEEDYKSFMKSKGKNKEPKVEKEVENEIKQEIDNEETT